VVNLVKEKLENGQKVIGTMFQLGCPTAVECLGISGLDFFIIDTEHAPVDVESIRLFILASEIRKITPFVRLKRISRDTVLNALDIGAGGLVAPGVETVQQVQELVGYAKYPPEGSRGLSLTRTSAYGYDGSATDINRYLERSNREVLVIPQCETRACLDDIEQIVSIKGVDGIFVGPYDLSLALGKPGDFDTPEFTAAIRKIVRACRKANKFVMIFTTNLERSRQYLDSGFDGIVFNSDADMFIDAYKKTLTELRTKTQAGVIQGVRNDIYGRYLSARNGNAPVNVANVLDTHRADIALIGSTLVLPDIGSLKTNLYIKDGRVSGISQEILPATETFDVSGKYVLPGIIDPHTHFGIGTDFDLDLQSETLSAAVGGLTTVGCFIGSKDARVNSYASLVEIIRQRSYTDVVPHFVIGTSEQIKEIPVLIKEFGIRTFKVYLHGIDGLIPAMDDAFVIDVMEELARTGIPCLLFVHCENDALVRRATRMANLKYGDQATISDWEDTHPPMAEAEAIMRVAFFANQYKQPIYVVHVSSAEGAEMIKKIKAENPYVYAETTSPYLTVTADQFNSTIGLMEPPLRQQADQDRLWQAIVQREIDAIGTDNVTLTLAEKGDTSNVWKAFPGYPALATHLMSILNEGVVNRGIPIEELVVPMTKRPAELLGLYPRKGTLLPGSDADLVVVDMNLCKTVNLQDLYSRADFSLFQGRELCCWPVMTIKNGIIVAQNGKPTGKRPSCKAIVSNSLSG